MEKLGIEIYYLAQASSLHKLFALLVWRIRVLSVFHQPICENLWDVDWKAEPSVVEQRRGRGRWEGVGCWTGGRCSGQWWLGQTEMEDWRTKARVERFRSATSRGEADMKTGGVIQTSLFCDKWRTHWQMWVSVFFVNNGCKKSEGEKKQQKLWCVMFRGENNIVLWLDLYYDPISLLLRQASSQSSVFPQNQQNLCPYLATNSLRNGWSSLSDSIDIAFSGLLFGFCEFWMKADKETTLCGTWFLERVVVVAFPIENQMKNFLPQDHPSLLSSEIITCLWAFILNFRVKQNTSPKKGMNRVGSLAEIQLRYKFLGMRWRMTLKREGHFLNGYKQQHQQYILLAR